MNKKNILIILMLVIAIFTVFVFKGRESNDVIKVGLITDLTGPAAYYGEKSLLGMRLVKQEYLERGVTIEILAEDYHLEAGKAATAAQKLLNIDKADIIYADFNPGVISVASVLKNHEIPFVYAAAIESPLEQVDTAFKTYLNYRAGCKMMAEKFKERGIEKLGMLKLSLEFGDLCAEGAQEVYGEDILVEGYNFGDSDFKTPLLKLKNQKAGAVINVGFEDDTYLTLKNMKEINMQVPYGTVADTLTQKVTEAFTHQLKGSLAFGYPDIDLSFKQKVEALTGEKLDSVGPEYIGAALAYSHLSQAIEALGECDNNKCFIREMSKKTEPNILGFKGFVNRIAVHDLSLYEL